MKAQNGLAGIVLGIIGATAPINPSIADLEVGVNEAYGRSPVVVARSPQRKTISEWYAVSTPADYIMPGARVKESRRGDELKGKVAFYNGEDWMKYYFEDTKYAPIMQGMFRELDGTKVEHNNGTYVFNFQNFHDFMMTNRGNTQGVSLFHDGFMYVQLQGEKNRVIIPLDRKFIKKVIES
jgi:hypothetical protein